jgi:hypothetical protein
VGVAKEENISPKKEIVQAKKPAGNPFALFGK